MKLAFIICLLMLSTLCCQLVAKSKIEWSPGTIKLNSGEHLKGNINYNVEFDIVSFQDKESIKAFSASKVASFEIYDLEIEEIRSFVSLDYGGISAYKNKVFFEVLLAGKISILRRYKALNQFHSLRAEVLTDNFGSYTYFALANGNFINLKRFKNNLLPLLKREYTEKIEKFLEKNELKPKHIEHQIVIIDYYNFLSEPGRKVLNSNYITSLN